MSKIREISFTDLLVNTENYRFDEVASQKEAIDKMVDEQNDKLFNLAEHIANNGLNPNDPIQVIVSHHDAKKFLVLEGNRRTVAVKLLLTPDIIDSTKHANLKKKFKKLHEEKKVRQSLKAVCTIYDDPTEANKWIKLKHTGQNSGIGTVDWNAQQIQRYEEKVEGKSSIALQAIKMLHSSTDVPDEIKKDLSKLPITNLDRLLSDPDVRDFLGIYINNGVIQSEVDRNEVEKGLAKIAKDLLNPKFNVKEIYTKDDRKDYISNFTKTSRPDISKKSAQPWQPGTASSPTAVKATKPKPNPKDRNRLIPKSCQLSINNPRLNAIYYELKGIDIQFTNSVSVLLRVFIELSLDCFIEANKLTKVTKDSKLISKVTEVANYLEQKKIVDAQVCKGIRSSANNKNDLLGIETLHAYVHNAKFSPSAPNLIVTWDNIQLFIEKVWENIK